MRKGFTLIEILIVVAIIAILASVVLIGLGPTQQSGRDARRLSDLHESQNAIELYFQKCGFYPGTGAAACTAGNPVSWADLSGAITTAAIGVSQPLPVDPTTGASYFYGRSNAAPGGTSYVVGATLENGNNAVFNNYPAAGGIVVGNYTFTQGGVTCDKAQNQYCTSL